ncbi:hypothetical protein KIV64_gp22 [Mycobacterium phage DroogsArmy]|uniref:Uncharacterized protein n=1 Tax=Mycobacterium phage DroogsArmy TaxID=2744011 RepID=A0A6N0A3Y2_9CAUD|nr:hypothetical protein KIV64_gp22 [Mycobacterium phage DroogsArmy]QKO02466.1 hypothetical protein SEA_DROOGSARMY_70 [Mycobacterium phage DroogsArmy]
MIEIMIAVRRKRAMWGRAWPAPYQRRDTEQPVQHRKFQGS